MPRVLPVRARLAIPSIFVALAALALLIAPAPAEAGSGHGYSKGSGYHSHGNRSYGNRSAYRAKAYRHGRTSYGAVALAPSAAASGVTLAPSGYRVKGHYKGGHKKYGYSKPYASHKRHGGAVRYSRDYGYGSSSAGHYRGKVHHGHRGPVVVVVDGGYNAAAVEAGGPALERDCAPGEYCTLRLGPYVNSPKIISLNRSGETLPAN